MSAHSYHRTTDGRLVDETKAFDAGVLRPGFTLRTKTQLMDNAGATLSSHQLSDAELDARSARIDAFNAKLSDAWRDPSVPPQASVPDALDVYDNYDRRTSEAWRQI